MKNPFNVTHRDSNTKARAGVLKTAHGDLETPVFMPVGTQASVKTLGAHEVEALGYKMILGNTYHLMLRPGEDLLKKAGGLHKFMSWPHGILTDSGGFQIFSLAPRCEMNEEGVSFSSHVDGSRKKLTPESATEFQLGIGSDIAMCLDECPPYPTLQEDAKKSLDLTHRWAKRCRLTYDKWLSEAPNIKPDAPQLLFGIVQGAGFHELRTQSALGMGEIGFPGYAVGGLGVGEPYDLTWSLLESSIKGLPAESVHYLMGFGQPEDFWEAVERGVDMFDCVLPTRNGRNGQAFTSQGRVNLPNATYREDLSPLDPECNCDTCRHYTRAYLCHLFRSGEMAGPRLVTLHNLTYMIALLRSIRTAIIDGNFQTAKKEFLQKQGSKVASRA